MNRLAELLPGSVVNERYLIKQILGQGGMGRTYLVSDKQRFNELRVLKEFVPGSTKEYIIHKSRELFLREAEVLYKLNHLQIPKFHAHFEEKERLFLVQDFINGKSYRQLLEERLSQGKTFSETEVIQLLKDLLPVLDYIHQKNIIHRDISPDNIMLDNSPQEMSGEQENINKPMLIDFGVVKQVQTQVKSGESIVGKIGYSPSEQIRLGQSYPNSDLYSLAVTALVLLTGKEPEELVDDYSLEWQWEQYVKLSDNLAEILKKMLEEIPGKRYQSAQEVLAKFAKNQLENNANFAFLEVDNPKIAEIGTLAENYLRKQETITCLMTLRQYGEVLAQEVAAKAGVDISNQNDQFSLLQKLEEKGLFQGEVDRLFHQLRKTGNKAVHDRQGEYQTALNCLKSAHKLGIWYHQTFVDSNFKPRGFILPPELIKEQQNKPEIRKNSDQVAQRLVQVETKQNKEPAEATQNKEKQLTEIITPSLPATQVNIPLYPETQISSPNQNNNHDKQRNPKIFALAAVAAVILLGLLVVSPYVSGICNTFENCAIKGKYQEKYKKATEKAEAAIQEAEVAKSVAEIQTSGDRLQSAIQELTEIPQDVEIHQEAQQSLKKYQSKQEQIEARQRKEEEVAEKFAAITIQSQEVAKATEIAAKIGEIPTKIQEYERAKAGWKQVQQSLLEIPPDVLIREQIEALHKDCEKQVEAIEVELKKLYVW